MKIFLLATTMMIMAAPPPANAQVDGSSPANQKAWLVSNFRSGLSGCSVSRDGAGYSLSGAATVAFTDLDSDNDGYDFAIVDRAGAAPSITAHAINTKGTGASNGRLSSQSCSLGPAPRQEVVKTGSGRISSITGGAVAGIVVARCAVSGDPDAPDVRFTIPLSSFGGMAGKTYVGHVTLIKRETGSPPVTTFRSRKGYDSWKAHSDMDSARAQASSEGIETTVIAACDSTGLSTKGSSSRTNYDLAVGRTG